MWPVIDSHVPIFTRNSTFRSPATELLEPPLKISRPSSVIILVFGKPASIKYALTGSTQAPNATYQSSKTRVWFAQTTTNHAELERCRPADCRHPYGIRYRRNILHVRGTFDQYDRQDSIRLDKK